MLFIVFLLGIVASQNRTIQITYNDKTFNFFSHDVNVYKLQSIFNISSIDYLEDLSGVIFYPYFDGNFPQSISSEVLVREVFPSQIPTEFFSTETKTCASSPGQAGNYWYSASGYHRPHATYFLTHYQFQNISGISKNRTIAKVYLRKIGVWSETNLPKQVFVFRCDSNTTDPYNWNLQPIIKSKPYSSVIIRESAELPFFWDVTDIVKGWVSGAFPNYGLQMRPNKTYGIPTFTNFHATDPIRKPCLLVYYSN